MGDVAPSIGIELMGRDRVLGRAKGSSRRNRRATGQGTVHLRVWLTPNKQDKKDIRVARNELPRGPLPPNLPIRDIHRLDAELAALEEQYGLLSADFYHCYRTGELEQSRDFIRWAGFYEAKQERETQYRRLVYEHFRELRRQSGLGALVLTPAGT